MAAIRSTDLPAISRLTAQGTWTPSAESPTASSSPGPPMPGDQRNVAGGSTPQGGGSSQPFHPLAWAQNALGGIWQWIAHALGGKQAPAGTAVSTTTSSTPAPSPVAASYTVVRGDTLFGIARRLLGNGNRWTQLYELNRDHLTDPNLIYPGEILKIPGTTTVKAQSRTSAAPKSASPEGSRVSNPNAYFLTQFRSRFNPDGPPSSADCGPTSLAMALKAFGKVPPGGNPNDPEQFIERTRLAMTGADNISTYTNVNQLVTGAQASGLQAQVVSGVQNIVSAVKSGKMVVLAGNPIAYEGGLSEAQYAHFNGAHFILVTGISGNTVTVNDPLSRVGTITLSLQQLTAFMGYQGWNTGTAVWS